MYALHGQENDVHTSVVNLNGKPLVQNSLINSKNSSHPYNTTNLKASITGVSNPGPDSKASTNRFPQTPSKPGQVSKILQQNARTIDVCAKHKPNVRSLANFNTPANSRVREPLGNKTVNTKYDTTLLSQRPQSVKPYQQNNSLTKSVGVSKLRSAKLHVHSSDTESPGKSTPRSIRKEVNSKASNAESTFAKPARLPDVPIDLETLEPENMGLNDSQLSVLPELPDDECFGLNKTFPQFLPENLMRGWMAHYLHPVDEATQLTQAEMKLAREERRNAKRISSILESSTYETLAEIDKLKIRDSETKCSTRPPLSMSYNSKSSTPSTSSSKSLHSRSRKTLTCNLEGKSFARSTAASLARRTPKHPATISKIRT